MKRALMVLFGAWLGLQVAYHPPDDGKSGWFSVCGVASDGPAQRAGLRQRDLIVAVNGKKLEFATAEEAMTLFANLKDGERVRLTIKQDGADRVLIVRAAPRD